MSQNIRQPASERWLKDDSTFVSGIVISNDSLPLPGATILINDSTGFISDLSGHLNFIVPTELIDSIRFEYIAHRPVTILNLPKIYLHLDLDTIMLFKTNTTYDIIDGYLIGEWWQLIHNIKARRFYRKQKQMYLKEQERVNNLISSHRYKFMNEYYAIDFYSDRIDLAKPLK